MSISEQVKELRYMSSVLHDEKRYAAEEIMHQAADTIEALSAKLAAVNSGGWISVNDRLPDKDDTVLIDTGIGYFEIATYSGDGKSFYAEECGSSCPVAWQYLPEPYRPQPQRSCFYEK